MTDKSVYTTEGALFELINRGKKDSFFFKDNLVDSVTQFDTRYNRTPQIVHERRLIVPRNGSEFGQAIEFELETAGDVIIEPTFLIQMPTWIPPNYQTAATAGAEVLDSGSNYSFQNCLQDASGVSYGWTNGIGYFLFSNIQVFQDNLLIQEFSGDALYASRLSRGTINSSSLDSDESGFMKRVDNLHISKNAVPGNLRLWLPLLGCQHPTEGGFPSIASRQQTYKIRAHLRRAEDLILASDSRPRPSPFSKPFFWSPPASADLYTVTSDDDFKKTVIDSSGYCIVLCWSKTSPPNTTPALATFLSQIRALVNSKAGNLRQVYCDQDTVFLSFALASQYLTPYVNNTGTSDLYFNSVTIALFKDGKYLYSTYNPTRPTVGRTNTTVLIGYPNDISVTQFVSLVTSVVPVGFGFTPVFTTEARTAMPSPTIQLEARHIYTDKDTQGLLIKQKHQIPYSRLYENKFTFGPLDYSPLQKGGVAIVTRVLDAIHPASRILWFFRNRTDLMANRYDRLLADLSGSEFYNSLTLVIAGRSREDPWGPLVWNRLAAHAKEDCDPGAGLGIMNWDVGAGSEIDRHEPQGSVNFTTADRPTFLIDLSGAQLQYTEMTAIVDTWTTFTFENGRGSINTF